MKVLVIDDTKRHRVSAAQIFTGPEYELTIASSYDEAVKLLEVEYSGGGIDKNGFAIKKKELPYWDAVLCDLLMPASGECCASCSLVGVEMPVGWSLALVAARRGAKFVAVVTDKDHHQPPASAMLDRLCEHVLNVDGAIACVLLDILNEKEGYSVEELKKLVEVEFFNALFVLSRSVGFIGHYLDQKRLDEGVFRLEEEHVAQAEIED